MVNRAGAISLGCLFWLLVAAAIVYFGVPAAGKWVKYTQYRDLMAAELQVKAKLPDYQLRNRFKILADSMGLPEDAGIITIERRSGRITITAHYEETIDLPGFKKEIHFEPKAAASY